MKFQSVSSGDGRVEKGRLVVLEWRHLQDSSDSPPEIVCTLLSSADALKISIENSKYLGGDLEHTHLVKGLDYALLHKVRSEIDKKPDAEDDAEARARPYSKKQYGSGTYQGRGRSLHG
ncbi:unnamed protein product [Rhodiola kirilowii]